MSATPTPTPTPQPSQQPQTEPHDEGSDRDRILASLLNQLADELHAGRDADIDALAARNPDLAEELRSLWGAMVVAQHWSDSQSRVDAGLPTPAVDPAATIPLGPRTSPPAAAPVLAVVGEFDILDKLGAGGMGIVYKARHRGLDRIVALKMVRQGGGATDSELLRFRQEAVSAARLDHPHVVKVYEVGEHEGLPFFTMQYVAGTTLAERLTAGPMAPREIAELMLPICEAVHAGHLQGILHRDLKPSNILINEEGRPLVTDFGLAKRVEGDSALTQTGAILGTPTHMAPEQAAGSRGRIGPWSDVYSLGVILYQMLTGRPPHLGASPMETILMVLEQEPVPPHMLNPRADRALEMMALRCLQKPPDLRYESAQALADDFRAYLADEPISARSGKLLQVVVRWLSETHNAVVLENWGLLWMWHSLVLLVLCLVTNAFQWLKVESVWPYLGLWVAGSGTWAVIFWTLRRRAGPVTFVERQVAHVWGASMVSIALLFPVERMLGLPTLSLSPVLGLVTGSVFFVKAGMLTGQFYVQAAALFLTAPAMALLQRNNIPLSISLFGVVSAACFFLPGWKYYRQAKAEK